MYYYEDSDLLVFATDYRAILDLPFIPVRIDENRVFEKWCIIILRTKKKLFLKAFVNYRRPVPYSWTKPASHVKNTGHLV